MPTSSTAERKTPNTKTPFKMALFNESNAVALRKPTTPNSTNSLPVAKLNRNEQLTQVQGVSRVRNKKTPKEPPSFKNDWRFWFFAALCTTSVCYYLIYQILSWKVLYCVVGIIVLGLGLRFYLEYYKTQSITDIRMAKLQNDREITLIQQRAQIQMTELELKQRDRELQVKQEQNKLENETELFNIQMQTELEKNRIAKSRSN